MSDYCTCCSTNTQYIEQHYDPSAITTVDERAEDVLDTLRACFPHEPCPLTLADVEAYLESLREEAKTNA